MMLAKLRTFTKSFVNHWRQFQEKQIGTVPHYRLVEIHKSEEEEYTVTVQIIYKNSTFPAKPEELLAHDHLINNFSSTDVRAITYLGYLNVNSPQYKILAKRLSKEHQKMIFALKKKGHKKVLLKTADEMMKEKEIIEKLSSQDANIVGYVTATESIQSEKSQREKNSDTITHEE